MDQSLSFDAVVRQLRAGEDRAAAAIVERFTRRLIAISRKRLDERVQSRVAPEDVLQSVFRTFFIRVRAGQFHLPDWESLWGLLVCLTIRKCLKASEVHRAAGRDVARERRAPEQDESHPSWQLMASNSLPEEELLVGEALEQATHGLNEREREILDLTLQAHSPAEICDKVGCSRAKVSRVLSRVESRLRQFRDADL